MEEIGNNLMACVMSKKGGVHLKELNADYKELVGEAIPFNRVGYKSLLELVHHLPRLDVDPAGVVTARATESTQHLQALIQRQKDPTVRKQKSSMKNDKKYLKRYQPYINPNQCWNEDQNICPPYQQPSHYQKYRHQPQQWSHNHPEDYQQHCKYPPNQRFYQNRYPPQRVPYYRQKLNYKQQYEYQYQQSFHIKHESQRTGYYDNIKQFEYSKKQPYTKKFRDLRELIGPQKLLENNNHWDNNFNVVEKQNVEIKANFFECFNKDIVVSAQRDDFCNGYQLIADDHMLSLTKVPTELCKLGLTAKKAILLVRQNGCPEKVVIALGTVDVLKGLSGGELILDMKQLVQTVQNVGAHVALCTVPPLPGIAGRADAIAAVNTFNRWVMTGAHGASPVNLSACFKDGPYIKHHLFDKYATTVPGCKFPIYHWNQRGCEAARFELNRCLV